MTRKPDWLKRPLLRAALPSIACVLSFSFAAPGDEIEEKQTSKRSFAFDDAAGARQVEVDNFEGSIQVTGYAGREVQLVVNETLEADSQEKFPWLGALRLQGAIRF